MSGINTEREASKRRKGKFWLLLDRLWIRQIILSIYLFSCVFLSSQKKTFFIAPWNPIILCMIYKTVKSTSKYIKNTFLCLMSLHLSISRNFYGNSKLILARPTARVWLLMTYFLWTTLYWVWRPLITCRYCQCEKNDGGANSGLVPLLPVPVYGQIMFKAIEASFEAFEEIKILLE